MFVGVGGYLLDSLKVFQKVEMCPGRMCPVQMCPVQMCPGKCTLDKCALDKCASGQMCSINVDVFSVIRVNDSITCFRPWREHISLYSFDILESSNTFMLKSHKLYTSFLSK